jgi:hypothetical protein
MPAGQPANDESAAAGSLDTIQDTELKETLLRLKKTLQEKSRKKRD